MNLSAAVLLGGLWVASLGGTPTQAYQTGLQMYQQGQILQSDVWFKHALVLVVREMKKKKGRERSLMEIGLADIYYHLGQIAWGQKEFRRGCFRARKTNDIYNRLPAGWRRWGVNPMVRLRFKKNQVFLKKKCYQIPGQIVLRGLPPKANVFMRQKNQWVPVGAVIPILPYRAVVVQIQAPGYKHLRATLRCRPWARDVRVVTMVRNKTLELDAKEPEDPVESRKVALVRPKPPAKPFKMPTWGWGVIIGGGALVLVVAIVVPIVVQPPPSDQIPAGTQLW